MKGPIGLGPIFIGLTGGMERVARRKIALEASVIAFCVLAGTALIGDWLLAKLGISLAAFRIAGGLLLFAIAFEMVFQRRTERRVDQTGHPGSAIAAFPLASRLMGRIDRHGDQHGSSRGLAYDIARHQRLSADGFRVLRFPNHELNGNLMAC